MIILLPSLGKATPEDGIPLVCLECYNAGPVCRSLCFHWNASVIVYDRAVSIPKGVTWSFTGQAEQHAEIPDHKQITIGFRAAEPDIPFFAEPMWECERECLPQDVINTETSRFTQVGEVPNFLEKIKRGRRNKDPQTVNKAEKYHPTRSMRSRLKELSSSLLTYNYYVSPSYTSHANGSFQLKFLQNGREVDAKLGEDVLSPLSYITKCDQAMYRLVLCPVWRLKKKMDLLQNLGDLEKDAEERRTIEAEIEDIRREEKDTDARRYWTSRNAAEILQPDLTSVSDQEHDENHCRRPTRERVIAWQVFKTTLSVIQAVTGVISVSGRGAMHRPGN